MLDCLKQAVNLQLNQFVKLRPLDPECTVCTTQPHYLHTAGVSKGGDKSGYSLCLSGINSALQELSKALVKLD